MWPSKKGGFAAAEAATRTSSKHSGPFKTLTVRRCSGHDWSPVMLQVALALRSRLLHCSFSCTLLWSRRSYLCCNDTVFVERCVRVFECVCARARSYFQALELRRAFPTVVLQLGLLGRQPHRLQSQVHLLHAELGPQLQVRKKTRRITCYYFCLYYRYAVTFGSFTFECSDSHLHLVDERSDDVDFLGDDGRNFLCGLRFHLLQVDDIVLHLLQTERTGGAGQRSPLPLL